MNTNLPFQGLASPAGPETESESLDSHDGDSVNTMNKSDSLERFRILYSKKNRPQEVPSGPAQTNRILCLFVFTLLLLFGVMTKYSFGEGSDLPGTVTLKGQIKLVDGGKILRKVRVPSFETVEAPVGKTAGSLDKGIRGRDIFGGTGEVSSLKQIYWRESTSYTEIIPLIFLREAREKGITRARITDKGAFRFESIAPGEYEITIAVPGYTPVVKKLDLVSSNSRNELEFTYSFTPSNPEESRLLKDHYNPESISDKSRADYERGVKAMDNAKLDDALVHLSIAIKRDEGFTEAFEKMGLIYFSRSDMEEAEKAFRMALKADPYSYRSLSNLGTILLNNGEAAEAVTYHKLAVKVRPQDPQARYNLAMSFFQLGDMENAADQLAKVKALEPAHFTQPQLLRAEIYRVLEDFDSMILELEDFLVFFPDDPKTEQVRQALADAREIKIGLN